MLPWLLIAAVTVLIYSPALGAGFIWNDPDYVTRSALQSVGGLARIWGALGATEQYYPVLHTAFWVEHRLWGDLPWAYHLLNILLHATAAILLGLTLRSLLRIAPVNTVEHAPPGSLYSTARYPRPEWLAALLFAVHPVAVESVAWVSEEKNTLSTVLYLLAALAYLRFERERRGTTYILATLLFVAALLSKSVTATLPVALLLGLAWRRGRIGWRLDVRPLVPWFALGAAAGLFTAWVEKTYVGAQGALYELSGWQRVLLAARQLWFYLSKDLWPHPLIFIYPRWTIHPAGLIEWSALGAAVLATGMLWRRSRAGFVAWAFFVVSLFPTMGFFSVYAFRYSFVADHWQYLAAIGVISPAAFWLARRPALGLAVAAALGALSWSRAQVYHDSERLYRTTLAQNPECWMASQNLASLLLDAGRPAEAIIQFRETLRIAPTLADAENNLGIALESVGRREDGLVHVRRAIALKPDYAQAYLNLGEMLLDENRASEALEPLQTAAALSPDIATVQDKLGVALAATDHWAEAVAHLQLAIRLEPELADAHFRLALVYWHLGRQAEAIAERAEALRLNPALPR